MLKTVMHSAHPARGIRSDSAFDVAVTATSGKTLHPKLEGLVGSLNPRP